MSFLIRTAFQEAINFIKPKTCLEVSVRHKVRKVLGNAKPGGNVIAKHRGIKRHENSHVHPGTILVTQNKTRFHPGLNVGFGRNGTLFALERGKVMITCEPIDPNYRHFWVRKNYTGREGQLIYKKHINVIPEKQHDRFVFKDAI